MPDPLLESSRKASFAPVTDTNTRLLILGSLPGEASLRAAQYYGHPRNQFWRLIGAVIGADLHTLSYPDRLAALRSAGIGLWDVVGSARRRGSLDAAIRDHAANDLPALIRELPELAAIAFNGGTAARLGRKALDDVALTLVDLPSSSPAYTLSFEAKLDRWARLSAFIRSVPPYRAR